MKNVSQLNDLEQSILNQFKENVKDCKLKDSSDDYILKWLVARRFNIRDAEKMLRLSLEWRRTYKIDDILNSWKPPSVLMKYYPIVNCGRDKFSCPIWINAFGRTDWIGILRSVNKKDLLRYVSYLAELSKIKMMNESQRTSSPVHYATMIIDMDGLSMQQIAFKPTRDVGMEITKITQANYPENLRKLFIINAPLLFTTIFAIIKPLLDQVTIDKIKVFGANRAEWQSALLEEIEADQLPINYGGTQVDPDGRFDFDAVQRVPESYYINPGQIVPDKTKFQSILIPSGAAKEFEFKIDQNGMLLRWEFMTEDRDIMFHVFYRDQNGKKVDLVPKKKFECHLMMEEGEISCLSPQIYVLRFDNTYSYFRSKTVWYWINLDNNNDVPAGNTNEY